MAQLFEDFGVGPRDVGMGNTGTATTTDYSAAFYNPGALTRAKGFGLYLGYKGVYPDLYMKIGRWNEKYFTQYPTTNFMVLGLSWNIVAEDLIDPKWTERFTLGLAVAVSDFYKSFAVPYDQDTPYFYRYHDRYLNLLSAYVSAGIRLTDWLSIGGGLVPAPTDTWSKADVDSNFQIPNYKFWANQGTITRSWSKVEPLAGLLLHWPDDTGGDLASFGLTWRDEVSTKDGNGTAEDHTKIHFQDQVIALPSSLTPLETLTGWTPMQVVAAVAGSPVDGLTITAEEIWKRWHEWLNFFSVHPDPPFHDTWNMRFGAEYVFEPESFGLQTLATRAGLYREYSPVPNQNGPSNYLDPDKWVFSAGLDSSWLFEDLDVFRTPLHLGVSGQYHHMDRVHLNNDADPDYPPLDAWGQVYSITATIGIQTE